MRELAHQIEDVSRAQGLLLGRLADAAPALRDLASLRALTEEVLNTSAIEGEHLSAESVRSSIVHRLGVDVGALAPSDRHVEGVVEMVLDSTFNCKAPVTQERLFGWHAALFPTGYSGLSKIKVGDWRDDASGPMQVVSGPTHRQLVHFQAPPADALAAQMDQFLAWLNDSTAEPKLIKAGLAHLWFVTLHPFDDGNGRMVRAIGDLMLARADGGMQRFYSLSAQIQRERMAYFDILERTQKRTDMDATEWLSWFLASLHRAVEQAHQTVDLVLVKARYWHRWSAASLNERQINMLNMLLDGFEGKLTSSKWASLAKCSPDTALRDITGLIERGIFKKSDAGGRSTSYVLAGFTAEHALSVHEAHT